MQAPCFRRGAGGTDGVGTPAANLLPVSNGTGHASPRGEPFIV